MDDEKETLDLLEDLSLMDDQFSEKYLAHNELDKHVTDGKLLNNANFRLIFVDENDNMCIIIPAKNPQEKADVKKRGYRCISHLWGADMQHPWKDHHVAGVEHDVEIRDGNKKKCLELFMKYKGYWWMDIFCVNQVGNDETKPVDIGALHIMGDIYRYCKECYCILDGSDKTLDEELKNVKLMYEYMKEKQGDVFTDVLKRSGIGLENHPFLLYIFRSKWINRVWTLQECVLPKKMYFVAEYDNSPIMSLDEVILLCGYFDGDNPWEDYEAWVEDCGAWAEDYERGTWADDSSVEAPKYTQEFYGSCIGTLRNLSRTASEYTKFGEIREMNVDESTIGILDELSSSRRISTKNVDYIYGIAGLLGITVVGDTIDKVRDSMIANLWSKDIFMSKNYRRKFTGIRRYDHEDEAVGLSKEFGKEIHQGIFVMSNKSTLRPKSVTKYSVGTVIHSIYSGSGFDDAPQFIHTGINCKAHQGRMADLCVKCAKTYKENFAITVINSGKQVKMGAIEMSELLSGDKDEIYVVPTCHIVNGILMNNMYVTEKYIIVLNECDTRDSGIWGNRYNIGDEVIIPLHGKFYNLYVGRMQDTGYEIATIVDIDKHGNKTDVGRIFNRKNATCLSYKRLRESR
jgi:hypothetical protein